MKWGFSIGLSLMLIFTTFQSEAVAPKFQKGVNIDIARKDYSLETIKEIVDTIAKYDGDYLQLHFADDQHHAIDLPGMSPTKRDTLSYEEIKTLMSDFSTNTVDYFDNQEAVKWSSEYLKDVMSLFEQPKFKGEQRIVIGGDEVPGAMDHQKAFVHFMNKLAETAKNKGYQPQIWNDSLTKQGVQQLDAHVSVLYWNQHEATHRQQAHVEDLAKANISVFNYNASTLYFLPSSQHSKQMIQQQQQEHQCMV